MDFFKRLSGRRVFTEMRQILEEENPTPAIMRLNDYDLLKVIHPSIELNNELIQSLKCGQKSAVLARFAFSGRILYEVGRLFYGADSQMCASNVL